MMKGCSGIYAEIYRLIESDTLLLPVLPDITLSIRQKLLDPECSFRNASNLLKTDPGLTAYIMRVTNCAHYFFCQPPRDVEAAVLRLGLTHTATLATSYSINSMFSSPSPVLKKKLQDSYKQSTKIAVISYLLAKKLPGIDADKAMLIGLLQDIAMPTLLLKLKERDEIFHHDEQMALVIDRLSPAVGALILNHWKFDEEIVDAVKTRKDWSRFESEKIDLADVVLIARWYALMGTAEFSRCPSFKEIPALQKLPASELTGNASLRILEDSRDAVKELQASLQYSG